MPSFDLGEVLSEDALRPENAPFRFGKGFRTDISLKDGMWNRIPDGRLWNLWIESEGAYSINLILDELYLPEDGTFHMYSEDGRVVYGPVTSINNLKEQEAFLTDLLPGKKILLEIFEPLKVKEITKIRIGKVVHAYKNMIYSKKDSRVSGYCNDTMDVACFYPEWDDESDAVGLVLLASGMEECSGSLLTNTKADFTPNFLTAFHCIDSNNNHILDQSEINNSENWLFRFQYKATQCDGTNPGTTYTYNKATFRAARYDTDFALLELRMNPVGNGEITWLGWDRKSSTPDSGVNIHHPQGDLMKIAIDIHNLNETSYKDTSSGLGFWHSEVDFGALEGGSSGSPLFNEDKRVVGQFKGGDLGCDNGRHFWHGCLYSSWFGGYSSSERLYNWLDPVSLFSYTTNTIRSPHIEGHSFLCTTTKTYSVQNIPANISQINWSASPASLFTNTSGTGSSFNTAWTGTSGGKGTITATLVHPYGSYDIRTKSWVGKPDIPLEICCPTGDPLCSGPQYYYQYGVNGSMDGTESFYWDLQPPGIIIGSNTGAMVNFYYPSSTIPGDYSIAVKSVNTCGSSSYLIEELEVQDCSKEWLSFKLYPNPASNDFTIEMLPNETIELNDIVITSIEILDISMIPRGTVTFSGNSTSINTGNLPNGVYFVKISVKGEKYSFKSSSEEFKEKPGDKVFWEKIQIQH